MLTRLKKNYEFKRVSEFHTVYRTPTVIVRAAPAVSDDRGVRVGFTASRRVGGAVVRNRAKRRLRALVDQILPSLVNQKNIISADFIFIASTSTATADFSKLREDFCASVGHCIMKLKR